MTIEAVSISEQVQNPLSMNSTDMNPLPLWIPRYPQKFNVGMEKDAPFIVTQYLQRSDLGLCIISTQPPHIVAKIRAFKTNPQLKKDRDAHNQKQIGLASNQEALRCEYFSGRLKAEDMAYVAAQNGCSVKELIKKYADKDDIPLPRIYDEEFDESRIIAKVPGLNVYLELFGCLDKVSQKEIQWDGPNGVYSTLEAMSVWAQNIWSREERRPRASHLDDRQLLPEWQEEYDETIRPYMAPKTGIGVWPDIDPSRRPDMIHIKAPQFTKSNIEAIRKIKIERVFRASKDKSK